MACHELLHVKRRDSWAVLLEEGARALLWAQPAAWGVLSGISLSREQAVDRAVVESTGDRRAYLRALAGLARLSQESPAAALALPHAEPPRPKGGPPREGGPDVTNAHFSRHCRRGGASTPRRRRGSRGLPVRERSPAARGRSRGQGGSGEGRRRSPCRGGESDILKVGGDVKEPVELTRVQPTYPEEARKNRVQGRVVLEAVIDEKGNVTKVEAIESPDPTLTDAAIEAVKKWTYKPATKKGKPVKVIMTVTVSFKLA